MTNFQLSELPAFIHGLAHRLAGIDYPHGHWILSAAAALILVIAPAWMVWHILGWAVRSVLKARRHQARLNAVLGRTHRGGRGPAGTDEPLPGTEGAHRRRACSPAPSRTGPLSPTLVSYVLSATARMQLPLILLSLLIIPATWFLLDIPKHIINHALADAEGHTTMTFAGLHLDRLPLLAALCASYLAVLTASTLLKYLAGQIRGRINERLVRRLRVQIVKRGRESRSSSEKAALAAVAVQEVEPIGYFGAGLLVVPLIQGGTLCASVAFLLVQNPVLALAALMMLPLQLTLLPRLQRTINGKVRERVYATRELTRLLAASNAAQEPVEAESRSEPETHVRRQTKQVRVLERLRVQINDRKGRLKGLYNYTSNLTPFFFFAIGGYLVVQGRLSLGALVAALAAYREIVPALKELFDFAQDWSDAHARFEEVAKVLDGSPDGAPRGRSGGGTEPAMAAIRILQPGG